MKKYLLEITTFIAGTTGMIIELVAARILSPYLGNSNLIWTCIIGMMLGFMSLGYLIGGKISDKHPQINLLALFLLNSAVFISMIPLLEVYAVEPLSNTKLNNSVIAIICSTITFGIPSMFLATASPFAVKLKDKELGEVGRISGRMSALSTIGSIVGTFLAGFILIPYIGVKNIILVLVIILSILSFILYEEKDIRYIVKSIITIILLISIVILGKQTFVKKHQDIIVDTDSEYSRMWIKEYKSKSGKKYKILQVDKGYESILQDKNTLASEYLKYYDLFEYYKPETQKVLMIGGAAYTYPEYFLEKFKDKQIDVVEIDSKMTKLAQEYFGLDTSNERLKIYHEDGRRYLNTTQNKYDCILLDAFKGLNIPFQLTTKEALESAKKDLTNNGIVITNIVSALEGKKTNFIKSEYATYKQVFKNVKIFKVQNGLVTDDEVQNIIIVAYDGDSIENEEIAEKYQNLLNNEITEYQTYKKILTDDLCNTEI